MQKVHQSIKAASAALGVSVETLRAAKLAGCPSFRGSRVYRAGLVEWLVDHPEAAPAIGREELLRWRVRRLKADCRALDHAHAAAVANLVPRAAIADALDLAEPVLRALFARLDPVARAAASAATSAAFQSLRHDYAPKPNRTDRAPTANRTARAAGMVAGEKGDTRNERPPLRPRPRERRRSARGGQGVR